MPEKYYTTENFPAKSPAMEEGSNLIIDPNTGIHEYKYLGVDFAKAEDTLIEAINFDDPAMWSLVSDGEVAKHFHEKSELLEATLLKFMYLTWFQHGVLDLGEEVKDDGEFTDEEWSLLRGFWYGLVSAEKEKKS